MKIKFLPMGLEVEGSPNKTLLQIATENKLEIRSICKGVPSCAECRVLIPDGMENIIPPTKAELNLIGSSYYLDGRRLSCQVRCFGDVTVDLSEQVGKEDNTHKKIRGFRTSKQQESHAVLDTLVLSERGPVTDSPEASDLSTANKPEQPSNQNQSQRQHQGQKQNHNNKKRRDGRRN